MAGATRAPAQLLPPCQRLNSVLYFTLCRHKYWASTPFSVKVNYKFESLPVTMINYNTLIFWWIAYTTKYYFLIATIVTLNTRLGNRLVLVIFWHLKLIHCTRSLANYHLSCSSFVFLGIVIVKVCFFPGADFLLNKALVKKRQQFSDERQKTSEQNGNRITCESSPCQEQDLSSPE